MAHVLGMPTLQVGDPVELVVLVKADDLPLQNASGIREMDRRLYEAAGP